MIISEGFRAIRALGKKFWPKKRKNVLEKFSIRHFFTFSIITFSLVLGSLWNSQKWRFLGCFTPVWGKKWKNSKKKIRFFLKFFLRQNLRLKKSTRSKILKNFFFWLEKFSKGKTPQKMTFLTVSERSEL